jgi:MFS family permease
MTDVAIAEAGPAEIQSSESTTAERLLFAPVAKPVVHPPLRRNKAFQTLWAGSAAATLGISVADVAYPLAILGVTGSPADAGFFAAAQTAGMILAGLPAGHLADRRSPRLILIVAEIGRALVTSVIVAALVLGWLSLPLLLIAGVLLGAGQPMTSTARMLLVRTVVPEDQLTSALTQDEIRINGAELAGPPLAGALYGLRLLAHALPFLFTAGAFVLSLVSALLVKAEPDRGGAKHAQSAPDQGAADSQRSGMLTGLKTIWANPVLRATTILLAGVNAICVGLGIITVVILRDQSVSSTLIGISLGTAAAGGLVGAALVRPLHRLRPGVLMITVCGLVVPLLALLAVPFGPWWMAGLLFVAMLGVPSIRVLVDVLILRQAPAAERGRVVGAVMTLLTIGMPAGLAVSGLLLQYLSAQAAVLILAGLLAAGVMLCAIKPELWRARWPE